MCVLLLLHLTPPADAGICVGRLAARRRPSEGRTLQGSCQAGGPPEEAGCSCEGGHGPQPRSRAPERFFPRTPGPVCSTEWAAPGHGPSAAEGGGAVAAARTFQRAADTPPHPTPAAPSVLESGAQPEGSTAPARAALGRGQQAHRPACPSALVCPCVSVTSEADTPDSVATGFASSHPESGEGARPRPREPREAVDAFSDVI